MASIKLSPDALRDYAAKIKANGNEASDLANRIKSNITAVTDQWEGEAKNKYLSAWAEHEPTLTKSIPELMATLAANLETIARNFEEADRT
ncbi:WXG100 family type VII secretion target [Clostridiales bacterium]|jgi:WXG100 family type VII secretion target|nr:WXG100 family type VII secretion target [Clostridiales bacterium]